MFIFKTKYVLSFLFNHNRQSVSNVKAADAAELVSSAEATGPPTVLTIRAFFPLLFSIHTFIIYLYCLIKFRVRALVSTGQAVHVRVPSPATLSILIGVVVALPPPPDPSPIPAAIFVTSSSSVKAPRRALFTPLEPPLLAVPPATATSAAAVAAPRPPPPPPGNVAVRRLVTLVQGAALVADQQRELTSERVNQLHQLALQSNALAALQRRQALNDNLEDELYDADDLNVRLAAALQSSNAPSAPSRLCPGVEFQAERWNSSVEASTRGIYPEYSMMQPPLGLQNTISAICISHPDPP